ncbi:MULTISPECIES: TetR/AcrR family transcriptional regulator [Streptomyces]|uniref:TetR/AcrR family transcriptional regulator n=1 Tax=Streptomyces TaxID=1883 RepID=UPI00163B79E5|nr:MULTISPECIES: TetR/AcrR family transcriptional regulator [Streptomyces]MBC2879426.1 TetR/AcrR family transcriptional regulator [Streptomyces sp. TYQ1024]UBI39825.1 TetR/AcrR family transcriptional regulator [Streptomyces mobaraensis]UKW32406.1 TetR/AcrR family transcriptional regulator [Streptomyces sp. TYQ1024]
MARWQPDAPGRLAAAALDLFEERGYENTTVIEIAERAGLTKSTFFRHFPDKREVLFGGGTVTGLLAEGIASAPPASGPLDAVADALDALGRTFFTADRREFSRRRQAVLNAHAELRERDALKRTDLTASAIEALDRRGVPGPTARVAAKLGMLVWEIAYDRWIAPGSGEDFGPLARQALAEVRAVLGS